VLAEQHGKPHRLGPGMRTDPLEHEVLGHFATGRQRAAHFRDRFGLAAQRNLGVEQRIARLAVGGALVGERHAREVAGHTSLSDP